MIELLLVWAACIAAIVLPEWAIGHKDYAKAWGRAYSACVGAWLMWVAM